MLTKKFLVSIKEKLLNEKQECLRRSSQKCDIDSDGDETDEVQANIQIDLQQKFTSLNKIKLFQIERALKEIEGGYYGICSNCDESITEKRLLANPCVDVCISCAEEREIEEKRKGL
jgi:RNA polymerase-binding transcription factor DksA